MGICSLIFGASHFIGLKITVQMIPTWMPGDPTFWAIFTGVAHAAVGIALIANRGAILATRLGGLMYLCFAAMLSGTPGPSCIPRNGCAGRVLASAWQ